MAWDFPRPAWIFLLVLFFLLSTAARAASHRSVAPLVSGGVRTRRKARDGLDRSDGGGGCAGCFPSHHAAGRGRRATQPGRPLPGFLPCGRTGTITFTYLLTKSKSEPLAWGLGMGDGSILSSHPTCFFAGPCCDVKLHDGRCHPGRDHAGRLPLIRVRETEDDRATPRTIEVRDRWPLGMIRERCRHHHASPPENCPAQHQASQPIPACRVRWRRAQP
jgi:hypothetical protein